MAVRNTSTERVINLDGPRGNAFAVMGITQSLLKQFKSRKEVEDIMTEMQSGDYINLLMVANREIGQFVIWETDNNEYLEILK